MARLYILILLSFSIIGAALWTSQSKKSKLLPLATAFVLIALRFLLPHQLTHNLFIIAAVAWLGPFLVQSRLITLRRFVIISLIWFAYDILYVWLTPLSSEVTSSTTKIGFPLALTVNTSSLGTGDLLWTTIFLSLFKKPKLQYFGLALLVTSNLALDLVALITNLFTSFPLLTLWTPLGLLYLKFSPPSAKN